MLVLEKFDAEFFFGFLRPRREIGHLHAVFTRSMAGLHLDVMDMSQGQPSVSAYREEFQ